MVIVYCVFDKCGNERKKNSKISFFSFPKELELLQKWLDFVNKHNPTKLTANMLDRDKMRICHMHFEKRQVQTKSNNDRALVRNSVPRCPPGIVDKAHALKKSKTKKKSKKSKSADSAESPKSTEASPKTTKGTQPALEGSPLYHTINGYVVDLRIAAQQDTFRLPNGKLIQVRRQPKKGSDTGTDSKPTDAAKSTTEISNPDTEASDKPVRIESAFLVPPANAHTEKASKTYTNRRTINQLPLTSTPLLSEPPAAPALPPTPIDLPSTPPVNPTATAKPPSLPTRPAINVPPRGPPVTPRPPTVIVPPSSQPTRTTPSRPPVTSRPLTAATSQPTRAAVIVPPSRPTVTLRPPAATSSQPKCAAVITPPSLSSLQALIHKTQPDTPFGNHLKEFENRLISTAELSLHIVSKINNLLHSNPYRNAEDTRDLKDLYHHVAYILKYAVDRFKGLEDNCVQDIQRMGFTKQSDLGPLLTKLIEKTPSKASEMEETAVAETKAEGEEDDDCAIIEERTDVIEVDSDDEDESGQEEDSDDQTAETEGITLNPKQLRICSDTESIAHDDCSNDSERVERVCRSPDSATNNAREDATEQQNENETHTEEATQIEVVMNEVEETTIVQDYYYADLSDDEDEDGETREQPYQGNDEVMDLDLDDDSDSEQAAQGDEEETEELIEIIEGDIDLELEDGQEYKVIEVIDGDYEMW